MCRYACNPSDAGTVLPHTIDQLIVPIRMRSTDRMIVPIRLRLTDRLIDELCAWPLSLPPLVPYYHPNKLPPLPPPAKPTPCCLAALLPSCSTTSIKKELPVSEYMDRNIWAEVTWSCIWLVTLTGDSSAPYLDTAILTILCFRYLLDKNQFNS